MTVATTLVLLAIARSAAPTTLPITVGKTQTIVAYVPATPSGPINIAPGVTEGGGIVLDPDGNWTVRRRAISNPSGPCITVNGVSNVRIVFNDIGPCGGNAIIVTNAGGVTIANNSIRQVAAGIAVDRGTSAIQVLDNRIVNVTGSGVAISFQRVTGAGHRIMRNFVVNEGSGKSAVSDVINLFVSSGTAADPIRVDHNILVGSVGSQLSSTAGINLGDGCDIYSTNGAGCQKDPAAIQWRSAYQEASGNILINAAMHGVSITGGAHMSFSNNVVFGTGAGFPALIYDFHYAQCTNNGPNDSNCAPPSCQDVTLSDTQSNFDGKGLYYPQDSGFENSCGTVNGLDSNNWSNTTVTPSAYHF